MLPLAAEAQERIFDGASLKGWSGNKEIWRVEDKAITAEIRAGERLGRNEFIFFDEQLGDFELNLQYRISGGPTANSGIQIRSEKKNGSAVGYQCDLDDGKTWLGRIYDEHGRALITERGTLTKIGVDGKRHQLPFIEDPRTLEKFAKKDDWNSYRIVAKGHRIEISINGRHFTTLEDYQEGQYDLSGLLAFQIHSGVGPAKIQFKDVELTKFESKQTGKKATKASLGIVPKDAPNIGFEMGNLDGWTFEGDAFEGQPVKSGALAQRMRGTKSNADGAFWYGGYEVRKSDAPTGVMRSKSFRVTHPWASVRVGGGAGNGTRVEIVEKAGDKVIKAFKGSNLEPMSVQSVNLSKFKGKEIYVRIVDEAKGGWGHINYDDFRFHETKPKGGGKGPLLWALGANPNQSDKNETVRDMLIPEGFEVSTALSEPQVKQPIGFTFDAKGRLWVAEAFAYPRRAKDGEGKDTLLIFEDSNGDGKFDKRTVFADNLNLVSGFEVGYGGVFVACAPEFLFIPDKDGDDVPDSEPVVLLDGFDTADTHETPNSFMWGNDGWLYGCHGVFNKSRVGKPNTPKKDRLYMEAAVWRYHPVKDVFEIYANGGSNQWGLTYSADGEMFMTHCRSAWGLGPVTQVFRDGHYWSQANRNHEGFIATDQPGYRARKLPADNYMTSVAAYGHGEGGAGKAGTRSIFGGHSHVGSMVYLGDNWPESYRGNLFTNNLHGSQMNRELLKKWDSAYLSSSQGNDQLYSADPEYLAVHLKYGPDGAVYFSDWADKQQCHNNRHDIWNRTNGRVYKMVWKDGYQARKIDLTKTSAKGLLKCLDHKNEWFSHMAQHEFAQRRAAGQDLSAIYGPLIKGVQDKTSQNRLRYLVSLHAAGGLNDALYQALLQDSDPVIVKQALVFLTEQDVEKSKGFGSQLVELAKASTDATVRLYLAGACQKRIAEPYAKQILEVLAMRAEDVEDRFIPKMIWYAYSSYADENLDASLALAQKTPLPTLRRSIYWHAMKKDANKTVAAALSLQGSAMLSDAVEAMSHALMFEEKANAPARWQELALKAQGESPGSAKAIKDLNTKFGLQEIDQKAVIAERKKAAKGVFMVCAACHAPGKDQPGPSLEEIAAVYDNKADIIKWVKNPGKKRDKYPNMPGFPHMTEKDLELVAEYLLDVGEE
ncbi:PVC-type heme-binding CxxCH protein [Rubritalea tangerina]|uniref:PVC-type heme-binding CxxCH protein n=1 Tax=Rubritalea tangerina TaxID=430798 RepID=UPI00360F41F5